MPAFAPLRIPTVEESLLTRSTRLLVLTAFVAVSLLILTAWLGWRYVLHVYAKRLSEAIAQEYQERLENDEALWQRAAQRLRTEINLMRLDREPNRERQGARLRAFFTAQGEYRDFDAILIADEQGVPLYSLGCPLRLQHWLDEWQVEGQADRQTLVRGFCSDRENFYVLVYTRLWLGPGEQAYALFAAALDNTYLKHLARRGDQVFLIHEGDINALSPDQEGLMNDQSQPWGSGRVTASLKLRPLDDETSLQLIIRRPFDPLVSNTSVALFILFIGLAFTILIWQGLGSSLRASLDRLVALSQGVATFAIGFRRDSIWPRQLAFIRERPDEIAQLGELVDALMQEAESRQREQLAYCQTLSLLDEAVIELDAHGRIQQASDAWHRVTGLTLQGIGQRLEDYLHPEDRPLLQELIGALLRGERSQATARLRLIPRGEERWLEIRLACVPEGGQLRGILRDITQIYRQEQRIAHLALHDALTGLPNRVLLEDRLKVAIRMANRSGHKVALGFIDLDHFKDINDNLGHGIGDALLVALAQRLKEGLRSGDTLARWGGDEFVVLLPDLPDLAAAQEVAAKLRRAIESPLIVEGTAFHVTFSAGFTLYPDHAETAEVLLTHADRAMFDAEAQGRNAIQFFSALPSQRPRKEEVYIQQRLISAIRTRRILNHYQPLVDAHTHRIHNVEALARWFEPDLGWISPATFIPMAENLGLIGELGEQVWHTALHDCQRLAAHGIKMAINLSRRQLAIPFFSEKLLEDIAAHGIAPEHIILEITESLIGEWGQVCQCLRELHAAGFRLALDDFGTGYSSLSQLHELPIHELKIDRSFICRVHTAQGSRLIQSIVSVASALGLKTVAEGVEDAQTARLLAELGVDRLQGFYFGRPQGIEEFILSLNG